METSKLDKDQLKCEGLFYLYLDGVLYGYNGYGVLVESLPIPKKEEMAWIDSREIPSRADNQ